MSYIVARVVEQEEAATTEHGFALPEIDFEERDKNTLDSDMDFETLNFVLGLIAQVDELSEGEALVVWKEIF